MMPDEENAPVLVDEYETTESAPEADLAVAEHLIADLLVRAWRAKQASKKTLADKRLGEETSRN
jgi:hypothetical protein